MFYDIFMELCRSRGLRPGGAAARIGFNRASVNVWRKTGRPPKQELLIKIAAFFGVTSDFLLEIEDEDMEELMIPILDSVQGDGQDSGVSDVLDYEQINSELPRKSEYFALRIKGDSMEPRFSEGDTVIIRRQQTADTGDFVVALVGDQEVTVKKLRRVDDGIYLQPLNLEYEPMFFSNEELEENPVEIVGRVVELRARF